MEGTVYSYVPGLNYEGPEHLWAGVYVHGVHDVFLLRRGLDVDERSHNKDSSRTGCWSAVYARTSGRLVLFSGSLAVDYGNIYMSALAVPAAAALSGRARALSIAYCNICKVHIGEIPDSKWYVQDKFGYLYNIRASRFTLSAFGTRQVRY